MRIRLHWAACVFAVLLVVPAPPAAAQVATLVDESGKRVFVNEEKPVLKTRAPAKAAPAGFQLVALRTPVTGKASAVKVSQDEIKGIVQEAADRHQIDPALVHAMIEQESAWNPNAVSRKGALGLMQLMPGTAAELGVTEPFDPTQNIDAGVRYLRLLLERFKGDLDKTLAAYNAGGGTVDRAGGVPNYPETRAYVQKITDAYFRPGSGRQPQVFRVTRTIYPSVDAQGRRIFTNE